MDINVKKGIVYGARLRGSEQAVHHRARRRPGPNHRSIYEQRHVERVAVHQYVGSEQPSASTGVSPAPPDLWNCWRASFGVEANDFTIENITLHNTTADRAGVRPKPFRGNADRTTLNRVILQSFQDTTRVQGTVFVTNSYIEGDVDFTWGVGAVPSSSSPRSHALRTGQYSMVRNDTNHGNVYINNRLDARA